MGLGFRYLRVCDCGAKSGWQAVGEAAAAESLHLDPQVVGREPLGTVGTLGA